ncbi:MAG: transglutaminase family protein cysteine peptidase, partial [Microvirga sp.]|nr:transglutaminase family protein cysteine peptidase [Microvirga sp.]
RMTVVLDELRAGHAVLMVRTDRGDFILDNKTNAVLPWSDTAYDYHKREGAEGLVWVSLSHLRQWSLRRKRQLRFPRIKAQTQFEAVPVGSS